MKVRRLPRSVMDIEAIPLADAYGRAALELAREDRQAEELAQELEALAELLASQPKLASLLTVAPMSASDRQALVHRLFAGRCSAALENLLGVLARKGRVGLVPTLARRFRGQLDRRQGKVEVTVTTAEPLDEELRRQVCSELGEILGRPPVLKARVDERLLGGLVLAVEGRLYDASLGTQLRRLRDRLSARVAAEAKA